ncbi:MAG: hypothetical protein D084_Lepto4C00339G0001, partial [Leptospirillum sp. Group IV 'UBA BS']
MISRPTIRLSALLLSSSLAGLPAGAQASASTGPGTPVDLRTLVVKTG